MYTYIHICIHTSSNYTDRQTDMCMYVHTSTYILYSLRVVVFRYTSVIVF